MVRASILWYSAGPIITLYGRITAREYMDTHRMGILVHPMIQALFLSENRYRFLRQQCPHSQSWNGSVMV
jgi:hypothetical protein